MSASTNNPAATTVRCLTVVFPPPPQDMYGDTALHDAIGKDNLEIIELLGNVPALDFKIKNKRGFNVLHHAALKGNNL